MPRQPGGGIYGYGVQGTVATLLGSAVVTNTARSGDGGILGILNSGSLSITNSTLSANSATSRGTGWLAVARSLLPTRDLAAVP